MSNSANSGSVQQSGLQSKNSTSKTPPNKNRGFNARKAMFRKRRLDSKDPFLQSFLLKPRRGRGRRFRTGRGRGRSRIGGRSSRGRSTRFSSRGRRISANNRSINSYRSRPFSRGQSRGRRMIGRRGGRRGNTRNRSGRGRRGGRRGGR